MLPMPTATAASRIVKKTTRVLFMTPVVSDRLRSSRLPDVPVALRLTSSTAFGRRCRNAADNHPGRFSGGDRAMSADDAASINRHIVESCELDHRQWPFPSERSAARGQPPRPARKSPRPAARPPPGGSAARPSGPAPIDRSSPTATTPKACNGSHVRPDAGILSSGRS